MKFFCTIFILAFASARPQRSYEEDSSLEDKDYESDSNKSLREDIQSNNRAQETDQQATEDPQRHLVDYGGNTFLQRTRSQPAAAAVSPPLHIETSDQGLSEENEEANADEAADEQTHKGNFAELRMRSKNRDNLNKVSFDKFAAKTDEQDSDDQEGLTVTSNAHNFRQAQHNREENTKAKQSQYSTNHAQTARVPVENNPRNAYESSLKIRNDESHNNDQSPEITLEHLSDAAEYEVEDGSPKYADNNEDVPLQKQTMNSFENDQELVNYETSNLDVERARGRRDAKNEITKTSTPEATDSKFDQSKSQDPLDGQAEKTGVESVEAKEQLAIKRHIANLSHDQLNELLASLPTDKKELLQEIIGSEKADIKKRDVTKRDGVLKQNKDQVESVASVDLQQSAEKSPETEINQGTGPVEHDELVKNTGTLMENQPILINKETGDNPVAEGTLTKNYDSKNNEGPTDLVKNEDSAKANDQLTNYKSESGVDKSNIKREISVNDYNSPLEESEDNIDLNTGLIDETSNESSYVGANNEEISHDAEVKKGVQLSKRDASQDKLSQMDTLRGNFPKAELSISEQLQALEESFPGVRSYDETVYQGQRLSPLVRVKRNKRQTNMTKRAAAVLTDAKEPYVPYRADTDDEDDDEGNEFDDEGFFDKTSNLGGGRVQSGSNKQTHEASETEIANDASSNADQTSGNDQYNYVFKESKYYLKKVPQNTIEQDLSSVGSDTDNVLSGSEGVDETLMLTSAARSRLSRDSSKESNSLGEGNDDLQLTNSKKTSTEELESVQNDPNGAFGGLPKNYDGELSRFKRIRRTKDIDPVA